MALILVTGASSGLGRGTANALADVGHEVVVHVRTPARLADAGGATRRKGVVTGDLADIGEITGVARQAGTYGRFDAVVHNAGVMNQPQQATVNVVAPYLFTALMDKPGRQIYLSRSMHRTGFTDLRRLATGDASYDDTKLWVTALALTLAFRWRAPPARRSIRAGYPPGWAVPAPPHRRFRFAARPRVVCNRDSFGVRLDDLRSERGAEPAGR